MICSNVRQTAVSSIKATLNNICIIITIAISNKGIRNSIANYKFNAKTIYAVISIDA
jgi:hypothetical protein